MVGGLAGTDAAVVVGVDEGRVDQEGAPRERDDGPAVGGWQHLDPQPGHGQAGIAGLGEGDGWGEGGALGAAGRAGEEQDQGGGIFAPSGEQDRADDEPAEEERAGDGWRGHREDGDGDDGADEQGRGVGQCLASGVFLHGLWPFCLEGDSSRRSRMRKGASGFSVRPTPRHLLGLSTSARGVLAETSGEVAG